MNSHQTNIYPQQGAEQAPIGITQIPGFNQPAPIRTILQNTPLIDPSLLKTATIRPKSAFADIDSIAPRDPLREIQVIPQYNNSFNNSALVNIRKYEGNYGTLGNIGDGAGMSVGGYQFTEKSGKAQKLTKMLGLNSVSQLTPELLNSPQGRKAQDALVMRDYVVPAKQIAKANGITDPKAVQFLIDTNINGGMHNVIARAKKMPGGVNLENLKAARKARYASLIASNPSKFSKFKDGWYRRVDSF